MLHDRELLERADLAFRQGELRRARHLLDLLLGRNPDHPQAQALLDRVIAAQVAALHERAHRRGWLDDGDPSSLRWALTLGGLFVLGCACVAAGLWLGLDILKQGMKLGFGHRVLANPSGRPGFAAHYPLHFLLLLPVLWLIVGGFLLWWLFRYLRNDRG